MLSFILLACVSTKTPEQTTDSGETTASDPYEVQMETTLGSITLELDPDNAPITTDNFLVYVDEGFYDGRDGKGATLFHRVIAGFMDQGGGVLSDGSEKQTHDPIALEAQNGLSNLRGTIAMARTNQPDSATSQFFLNTVDNTFLDATGPRDGYAVFGTVTAGLDTLDAIAAVPTDGTDRPVDDIVITSCTRQK